MVISPIRCGSDNGDDNRARFSLTARRVSMNGFLLNGKRSVCPIHQVWRRRRAPSIDNSSVSIRRDARPGRPRDVGLKSTHRLSELSHYDAVATSLVLKWIWKNHRMCDYDPTQYFSTTSVFSHGCTYEYLSHAVVEKYY